MTDVNITAQINPLAFLKVDGPWASAQDEDVVLDDVFQFLCNPGDSRNVSDLIARYKVISVENPRLFAAPSEARLLERLIWPLRQAKGNFMLGHFLATVSLCGMVSEMAAILTFDLGNVRINEERLDEQRQKALFGATFEKQGQERRVEILLGYGLIDAPLKRSYDAVRTARRKYLHLWSADHTTLERDAVACFTAAVTIVVSTLGLSVRDGKLALRKEIFDYLAANGAGPNIVEQEA
jgi:hypothetical protein